MTALLQLKIWAGRSVENMITDVYAKFRCAALRIKKALGIFRELITTTRSRSQSGFLGPAFRVQKVNVCAPMWLLSFCSTKARGSEHYGENRNKSIFIFRSKLQKFVSFNRLDRNWSSTKAYITTAIRLRYDDTTTHSNTMEVIEITICVRFECDTTTTKKMTC